jgi:trimeric autotransporter adhesin
VQVAVNVGTAAATLAVQVTNPNGQAGNSVNLSVTALAVAPTITALNPNPMTGSSSAQTLTINGSGFVSGLKVTVGSTTYSASSVSASQVQVAVNVGTAAATLAVQVTNPNGQASNSVNLSVTAPIVAPTISTLSPNPITASTSVQTLTVNGSGFVSGAGLKVTVGSTSYIGSQITSASATRLQIAVNVGAGAATLAVQVTNPSGQASNSVNLSVTAPTTAGPVIVSLSPNPMTASNSAQTLTINGSGFQSGLKLMIGGAVIPSFELSLMTSTELQLNVITGLTPYTYPVQVVDPNGTSSNTVNLQVIAPTSPAIASLSPNPLTHSSSAQTLTVSGSNFQSGSGLKVSVGNTYTGSAVTFLSPTQLTVAVTVPSASTSGLAVQVTNPSGGAPNAASLPVM